MIIVFTFIWDFNLTCQSWNDIHLGNANLFHSSYNCNCWTFQLETIGKLHESIPSFSFLLGYPNLEHRSYKQQDVKIVFLAIIGNWRYRTKYIANLRREQLGCRSWHVCTVDCSDFCHQSDLDWNQNTREGVRYLDCGLL